MTESGRPVGALVFANSYTALGVVRSLGRRGIPVWVLGNRFSLAGVSRYAERTIQLQGDDEPTQIDSLIDVARTHKVRGWVLFPDGDRNVAFLARNHATLSEYYTMTVPPWDVARWALDKHLTYQLADELGIDYPKTFYPQSLSDAEKIDGAFPMILKPADHQGTDHFSVISGAWKADDREQLLELYRKANDSLSGRAVIAVQEMVPGGGETQFSFAALCREGQVLASVMARRTRILPAEFGASSYAESIEPVPEVQNPARRWLERMNYTGLAECEFKYHAGTGRYNLLDVNVRPWGWHAMTGYAGVDFPYLMWLLALGEGVSAPPAKVGVRWVRLPYDAMSALQLIRRGTLTWGDYIESLRGAHVEMWVRDDVVPAFREVPLLFRLLWNKLRGR